MNLKNTENQLKTDFNNDVDKVKGLENASEREVHETYLAGEILLKLSKGEEVSEDQIVFLKEQSEDIAKALVLIGLQAIPGSSIAIIALEKIAEERGFTLFPKAEDDPIV